MENFDCRSTHYEGTKPLKFVGYSLVVQEQSNTRLPRTSELHLKSQQVIKQHKTHHLFALLQSRHRTGNMYEQTNHSMLKPS
jgi:hypothetical protein